MILKIDHITFTHLKNKGLKALNPEGYNLVFHEKTLPNTTCKMDLLEFNQSDHGIIFLKKEDCISIEITEYDFIGEGHYYTASRDFRVLKYSVDDLETASLFWNCFGFKLIEGSETRLILCYKSIIDNSMLTLEIKKDECSKRSYLDSEGFCCIAFITSSIEKEVKKLRGKGYPVSEKSELVVNGQLMEMAFVCSPSGEIVELIEIRRNPK
ncbi:VOC family protein [Fusibacter sp. 3D3]|uniref:VOC family protein n=1 Tax=Fusibacter sp. 3D3 TaxID=1048380 RepID=UPI000852ECAE|nr:hypothetical protein [Fusibacter sp. 3D3]GAU80038.1 hypothetical protein F3D3_4704 [Fusibacter sp. 3D3]